MRSKYENFQRIFVSKQVQAISTALVVLGSVADIISQSPSRKILPDLIEEHAGNFGLSALPIVSIGLLSKLIEERGKSTNNSKMENFGKSLYSTSIKIMFGIEVGVESQFISHLTPELFKENLGDFSMGIFAVAISALAIYRFRHTFNLNYKNKIN